MSVRGRRVLTDWRIGTAVLLAIAAQGSPGMATTPQSSAFSPPLAPLLLTRTL